MARYIDDWAIFAEIQKLAAKIEHLEERFIQQFRPLDSISYINYDLDQYEVAWLYKGVYHRYPSKLYKKIVFEQGYDKLKAAFVEMLNNSARQDDMWIYEINYVLLSPIGEKHYISSAGHLLSKSSLNVIQTIGNTAKFMENGEVLVCNLGVMVYNAFINENHSAKSMRHMDSNLSNNSISNLQPHAAESEYVKKKGLL